MAAGSTRHIEVLLPAASSDVADSALSTAAASVQSDTSSDRAISVLTTAAPSLGAPVGRTFLAAINQNGVLSISSTIGPTDSGLAYDYETGQVGLFAVITQASAASVGVLTTVAVAASAAPSHDASVAVVVPAAGSVVVDVTHSAAISVLTTGAGGVGSAESATGSTLALGPTTLVVSRVAVGVRG